LLMRLRIRLCLLLCMRQLHATTAWHCGAAAAALATAAAPLAHQHLSLVLSQPAPQAGRQLSSTSTAAHGTRVARAAALLLPVMPSLPLLLMCCPPLQHCATAWMKEAHHTLVSEAHQQSRSRRLHPHCTAASALHLDKLAVHCNLACTAVICLSQATQCTHSAAAEPHVTSRRDEQLQQTLAAPSPVVREASPLLFACACCCCIGPGARAL
jgi:hypothetical protein